MNLTHAHTRRPAARDVARPSRVQSDIDDGASEAWRTDRLRTEAEGWSAQRSSFAFLRTQKRRLIIWLVEFVAPKIQMVTL